MKKQLTIISLLVCMISCREADMDDTIFIPDLNNNSLPAYTERGYNSFGAVYERTYFLANRTVVPCKVTYKDGQVHFALIGHIEYNSTASLTFSFPAQPMDDYTDLLSLHQKSFDLRDPASCKVMFDREGVEIDLSTILSGNLNFKRAQLLRIDEKENRVILSGTFEIRFLRNGQVENISEGRFDIGINTDFHSFM